MMKYYNQQELYHYGVLGMKWGVRRYQNFDGSYTKAGLERYRKAESTYEKRKGEYNEKPKEFIVDTIKIDPLKTQDSETTRDRGQESFSRLRKLEEELAKTSEWTGARELLEETREEKIARILAAKERSEKKRQDEAKAYAEELLKKNNEKLANISSSVKNGVYNDNLTGNAWFDQFNFVRKLRMRADGSTDPIDVPSDPTFFAKKYAEHFSKVNGTSYEEEWDGIIEALARQGEHVKK